MKNILLLSCVLFFATLGYAQDFQLYHDTVYGAHIRVPIEWRATYSYSGAELKDIDEQIFKFHYSFAQREQDKIYVSVSRVKNQREFLASEYGRNKIYKVFCKPHNGRARYISDEFPHSPLQFDVFTSKVYFGPIEYEIWKPEDPSYTEITLFFYFINKDDILSVCFNVPCDKFQEFKSLFFNIANSVYFE